MRRDALSSRSMHALNPINLLAFGSYCLLMLGLSACSDTEGGGAGTKRHTWPVGDLVDVAAVADSTLLVASAKGTIYRSDDAGAHWQRARGPAVKSLSALVMVDAESGWAVGDGVILKTDEAGLSWRRQRLPRPADEIHLFGVAALDPNRAVAVGADGLRLYTVDGGAVWKEASPLPDRLGAATPLRPLTQDLYDVACERAGLERCWAVGEGIFRSLDGGATWQSVPVGHASTLNNIVFEFEGVEIEDDAGVRIRALAEAWRYVSPVVWQIEVFLGEREVERIGRQRDPAALLELIEARAQEARSLLESSGIPAMQIEMAVAPPWNYEDSLDEDPEGVLRYFAERTRPKGGLEIRIDDQARLYALAIGEGGVAFAVGEAGKIVRRVVPEPNPERGDVAWLAEPRTGQQDLFSVGFAAGDQPILVGAQGGFWETDDTPGQTGQSRFKLMDTGEGPGAFGAFRAIAMGRAGNWGAAVGEDRIWVAKGTPLSWKVISNPEMDAQLAEPAGDAH